MGCSFGLRENEGQDLLYFCGQDLVVAGHEVAFLLWFPETVGSHLGPEWMHVCPVCLQKMVPHRCVRNGDVFVNIFVSKSSLALWWVW